MSLTSFSLGAATVEYFGDWRAICAWALEWVQRSGCFRPRFVLLPGQGITQVVPATGKIEYRFQLEPNSVILGLMPFPLSGLFQLTEVCTDHQLFQDATSGAVILTAGSATDDSTPYTLLPCAWEASGDGWFKFEVWNDAGATQYVLLLVAEVKPC